MLRLLHDSIYRGRGDVTQAALNSALRVVREGAPNA